MFSWCFLLFCAFEHSFFPAYLMVCLVGDCLKIVSGLTKRPCLSRELFIFLSNSSVQYMGRLDCSWQLRSDKERKKRCSELSWLHKPRIKMV